MIYEVIPRSFPWTFAHHPYLERLASYQIIANRLKLRDAYRTTI